MGKPNSKRVIAARREKILEFDAKNYSQSEMMKELGVTRQTISSDLRFIREQTRRELLGSKMENLIFQFYHCIHGVNEVQREAWKIYKAVIYH